MLDHARHRVLLNVDNDNGSDLLRDDDDDSSDDTAVVAADDTNRLAVEAIASLAITSGILIFVLLGFGGLVGWLRFL